MDSNAPPQIRGIPLPGCHFDGGTTEKSGSEDSGRSRFPARMNWSGGLSAFGMTSKGNYPFAGSAPVVAKKQPFARGRPLTKLRDGPMNTLALRSLSLLRNDLWLVAHSSKHIAQSTWLKAHGSKHYWDWNAPPDKETGSCHLDRGTRRDLFP